MNISSSSSSFDAKLSTPQNATTTTSCITGILRRFFSSGSSLRTHPFECNKGSNPIKFDCPKDEEKKDGSGTPGLVARLMGLDSMPELNAVPTRTPESIGRSRSVSSVDYWFEFDPTQGQHRRVKSSTSLREMPTFLQQEDDEFLILSFENVGDLGCKNPEMGCRDLKQGRADGHKNRGNRGNRGKENKENQQCNKRNSTKTKNLERDNTKHSSLKSARNEKDHRQLRVAKKGRNPSNTQNQKEICDKASVVKNRKIKVEPELHSENSSPVEKKIKVETELHSENSSPVSVFDLNEFTSEPESLLSEEDSKLKNSESRRKLSPELGNSEHPCSHFTCISILELSESKSIDKQSVQAKKTDFHSSNYLELWEEVGKLTEDDMNTSKWMPKEMKNMEEFQEIGTEFGLQILDQLVDEIVAELGGLSM